MRIPFLKLFNLIGDHSGCHQIPQRCFRVRGYLFPICARCTGVLVGQTAAVIAFFLGLRLPWWTCLCCLVPMGVDWLIQYLEIKESTNARRCLTGFLGGFGLFSLYFVVICILIHALCPGCN